ncbi:MAG TPA: TetR/AcrR family transcriptional regulator [Candidatus Kapabacteria bacterium]|nr:TetR/AcrR family transcriptional regulator [Candidatus Kapabacteria bacterium]
MTTTSNAPARTSALSRDRIIKAAYQIAKKDPNDALSMRKIATKLKVTPMAIYKYFSDKSELIAAVVDHQMTESNLIPDNIDHSDWRSWVKESFLRMWDAYDSSPGMAQYMSHATSFGPAVLNWQNETLKVLITAGLTPKQALTAHAAMAELATGSTILVPIRQQGVEKVFPTIWKDLKAGKAPDLSELNNGPVSVVDYPWLLMCGQAMLENMHNSRDAFSAELDLILDGLTLQLAENKKK